MVGSKQWLEIAFDIFATVNECDPMIEFPFFANSDLSIAAALAFSFVSLPNSKANASWCCLVIGFATPFWEFPAHGSKALEIVHPRFSR
jgi:hypothetical protein